MDSAVTGVANIEDAPNVAPRGSEIPNPVVSRSGKNPKVSIRKDSERWELIGQKRTFSPTPPPPRVTSNH